LIVANDEKEAIDEDNIIKGDRLRHAKPEHRNAYQEKEEDDLPAQ
jgi:hypothetical protein